MRKSEVLSLSTTVRPMREVLRVAPAIPGEHLSLLFPLGETGDLLGPDIGILAVHNHAVHPIAHERARPHR